MTDHGGEAVFASRTARSITTVVPDPSSTVSESLFEHDLISSGASTDADELVIAVSRLFLDNIDSIQSSWVKYGDEQGLKMLNCGADHFMGTILSEEITKCAGGYGEFRSSADYVAMISSIGRVPVERSTDYGTRWVIVSDNLPFGPRLGPKTDGTPLLTTEECESRTVIVDD